MGNDNMFSGLIICESEFPCEDPLQIFRFLQSHSQKSCFPLLARFLSDCTVTLRTEIGLLPRSEWQQLSNFQSLLSLASLVLCDLKCSQRALHIPLEGALLCASQIALLIGNFEADNLEYDLPQQNLALLGFHGGLFAATAISASQTILELASIGPEIVRAAFRFHSHVDQISRVVEPSLTKEKYSPWGYAVTGIPVELIQEEVSKFNTQMNSSVFTKVCVSNTEMNSVNVTGPPTHVNNFFHKSKILRNSQRTPVKTHGGLCHITEIYGHEDVKDIVEPLDRQKLEARILRIPLLTPSEGIPFNATNAFSLLELVCEEALNKPHHQDRVVKAFASYLRASDSELLGCRVLSYGKSMARDYLSSDIKTNYPDIKIINHDLTHWTHYDSYKNSSLIESTKLAVVGMSCRLPGGANNPELLFELLAAGRDVHTKVPADRFDIESHFDPTGVTKNASETPYGNFIENPGLFDASFFNMSPREAEQTDPMHRLALVTAYEALEMSGFSPNRTLSTNLKRVGTFYGVASDDYREVNAGQDIGTHATPGGERAFANGRINYFFKFGGPSINIDTACSSSGAAIDAACSSLWAKNVDLAVAGGLNIITNPDNYSMLSKGHFLSKTGQCKVWSKEADGYCRADGIGSIIIKRLEDAIADNDNIIATIVSASTNHAAEAVSITHPHVGAQIDNYNLVLEKAGVDPLDVSYIELHGTGTQAGDGVESNSVAEVFAPLNPARNMDNPLYLGAIKSNIGHSEAAAGVSSFIKVLLAYQKNMIPRNIGIGSEMNPLVSKNISNRNIQMVTENTPWPRTAGKKRYAVANSFGAHGGNTTFLLEDGPTKVRIGEDPRSVCAIVLSAKSTASLKGNIKSLTRYLDRNPNTVLGDLSYTLCARRIHHHTRIGTFVTSTAQLKRFLVSLTLDLENLRPVPNKPPNIAFGFSGQGSLYDGLAMQLYQYFPSFSKEVLKLDRVSQQMGFPSVVPLIERSINIKDASPIVTQLTLLIIEIALTEFWKSLGVIPSIVVGHSLGEYAALVAAGVLSAADAIFLVGKRAEIILAVCKIGTHSMLSVRASVEVIEKIVNGLSYEVACLNSATDTVIAGTQEKIQAIQKLIERNGLKCARLEIPYAFHTSQMDDILDLFEEQAAKVTFHSPNITVISPLLETCVSDGKILNAMYLRRSTRETVKFANSLTAAAKMGIIDDSVVWLNIGPRPVSFIQSHSSAKKVFTSLRRCNEDFSTIIETLVGLHQEGVSILWSEYFAPYEKAHNLLDLEQYSWNQKDYWIPYRGTWTLDKAYEKGVSPLKEAPHDFIKVPPSPIISSSIHNIVLYELQDYKRRVITSSDIMRSDLWSAVHSHRIRDTEVAPSSIWVDMAYTIAEYLYKDSAVEDESYSMNLADFNVFHSTLARKDRSKPQLIEVRACLDLKLRNTTVEWYKISLEGVPLSQPYASAIVYYQNPIAWKKEWRVTEQFVNDRVKALSAKALEGSASSISRNMIYSLYKNIVEYDEMHQGMQNVILDGYEAFSQTILCPDMHGDWFTPPHYLESILGIAGFIMNCSDVFEHQKTFAMCPGWGNLRFLKRLKPGDKYSCYTRMVPSKDHRNFFCDVFVMQEGKIIGMCTEMKFRRVPRSLMDTFFAPNVLSVSSQPKVLPSRPRFPNGISLPVTPSDSEGSRGSNTPVVVSEQPGFLDSSLALAVNAKINLIAREEKNLIVDIMRLIAHETGIDINDFRDESTFYELGVDSLTSLVLAQKFRDEMSIEVHSTIFLDFPSVKEFKGYLRENY